MLSGVIFQSLNTTQYKMLKVCSYKLHSSSGLQQAAVIVHEIPKLIVSLSLSIINSPPAQYASCKSIWRNVKGAVHLRGTWLFAFADLQNFTFLFEPPQKHSIKLVKEN